jgi:hypothetical protein
MSKLCLEILKWLYHAYENIGYPWFLLGSISSPSLWSGKKGSLPPQVTLTWVRPPKHGSDWRVLQFSLTPNPVLLIPPFTPRAHHSQALAVRLVGYSLPLIKPVKESSVLPLCPSLL